MPTLQEQINAAPSGGTLNAPGEFIENITLGKPLTLIGAKIVSPNADPAVKIPPRTRDVVLRDCEMRGSGAVIHSIVEIGVSAMTSLADVPTNITIDHCDIHGHTTQEVQRGVAANGANVKIMNSKIWEIHGRGYDTQAICCWNGPGPFLIEGCYLEAAGENVMFGGSPAAIPNLVPTDIIIRHNYFFKPLTWYVNDPSYAGIRWSVKNLFELKNARNVVIEGNIFENNWADAQAGRAIVFTPRPSDSGLWAVIEDVEFINNIVRNVGSGMLILGADEAGSNPDRPIPTETRLRRVRVANNLWENVDGKRFGSNGYFLTVINKTEDVTVEHNTALQTGHIIGTDYAPNARFIYRDNISRHNEYGIFGGGKSTGNATISYYFPDGVITGNVIAKEVRGGSSPSNHAGVYPAGNFFPETLADVGFGEGLRLALTSPFKGKGTGGSDPGCDIDVLMAAIGGLGTPAPLPTPTPTPTPTPEPEPAPTPDPAPTPSVPRAVLTFPASGATVSGSIMFTATAEDAAGIANVYFVVDDTVMGGDAVTPYAFNLDTKRLNDGNHVAYVRAWNKLGKAGDSAKVTFMVANAAPVPTPTPVPDPVPQPAPVPCSMSVTPTELVLPVNGMGIVTVNLLNMVTPTEVTAIPSSGQVTVNPGLKQVTGTSASIQFQVGVKRKGGTVTFKSGCGSKVVVVKVS